METLLHFVRANNPIIGMESPSASTLRFSRAHSILLSCSSTHPDHLLQFRHLLRKWKKKKTTKDSSSLPSHSMYSSSQYSHSESSPNPDIPISYTPDRTALRGITSFPAHTSQLPKTRHSLPICPEVASLASSTSRTRGMRVHVGRCSLPFCAHA